MLPCWLLYAQDWILLALLCTTDNTAWSLQLALSCNVMCVRGWIPCMLLSLVGCLGCLYLNTNVKNGAHCNLQGAQKAHVGLPCCAPLRREVLTRWVTVTRILMHGFGKNPRSVMGPNFRYQLLRQNGALFWPLPKKSAGTVPTYPPQPQ